VLDHPEVRRLLDPDAPTGLLMAAVLHFVPDDNQAYAVVEQFVGALRPGSYLVVSHAAAESFDPPTQRAYRQPTATPAASRTRAGVTRFFAGLELLEPGVVGLHEWHVEQDEQPPAQDTHGPGGWVGVARKP